MSEWTSEAHQHNTPIIMGKPLMTHNCGWKSPTRGGTLVTQLDVVHPKCQTAADSALELVSIKWPEWLKPPWLHKFHFGWTLSHLTQPPQLHPFHFGWTLSQLTQPPQLHQFHFGWTLSHLTQPSQLHQFHFGWTLSHLTQPPQLHPFHFGWTLSHSNLCNCTSSILDEL